MFSEQHIRNYSYGCIFCKTGYERMIVQELSQNTRDIDYIAAQKRIRRRMFPGYVFFRGKDNIDITILVKWPAVLRVLSNGIGQWQLVGNDYRFAEWLFLHDGVIGFSKAFVDGNMLRFLKGPLKGHEGQVIKINRRFQNCLVLLRFEDREFRIWLGYELMGTDSIEHI